MNRWLPALAADCRTVAVLDELVVIENIRHAERRRCAAFVEPPAGVCFGALQQEGGLCKKQRVGQGLG